ncbi:molybdate transport system substrate-binding protein [Variovorax paradoxus]|uniref:Molybdate transport system substrate-binding protein n=1 Tax=Variovorax paradoxus TaxID=34073 RepID=A0AAW8EIK5_VARPD|nr:substrate-binding domain-containing protein [Variovorax paradoxus]MDP9971857.1 molybdate transport system substrate-binding protein [Variovorax paradoxus]
MTVPAIRGLCSMATRGLLQELAAAHSQRSGVPVSFLAIGGVEAARRVSAGEPFDVVVLASDGIDALVAQGRLDGGGKVDLVRSGVAVAVPAGAARPDISTEDALRSAVRTASGIAYSTGPSGVALMALFERWGIAGEIRARLVQAPPGVPVGALLARGDAALGFQQWSELIGVEGVDLVGPLPPEVQITTVFSAAPVGGCAQPAAVRALLESMRSADSAEAKRRHGMAPA